MTIQKGIRLDAAEREKLRELAYQERGTMSGILSMVVSNYAKGSPLPKVEVTMTSKRVGVKFDLDDETWLRAKDRARAEGISLNQAVLDWLDSRLASLVDQPA